MFTLHNTNTALLSVIKAANFAALKHKDQRKRDPDKTPYINQPIGVATIIIDEGKVFDPTIIQAAFLHDTVEDTDTTLDEIEQNFGYQVRQIVSEVTDVSNLSKSERRRLQIANAKKKSKEAQLITLAVKLYNIRDIEKNKPINWTSKEIDEFYKFAKMVIDEIRGVNVHLEKKFDQIYDRRKTSLFA